MIPTQNSQTKTQLQSLRPVLLQDTARYVHGIHLDSDCGVNGLLPDSVAGHQQRSGVVNVVEQLSLLWFVFFFQGDISCIRCPLFSVFGFCVVCFL